MESPPRVLPWHPPGTSPSQNPAPSSTATISTRLLPTGPVRQARAQHRTRPMDTATRSEKHSLRRRRPLRRQAEVSLFCFGGILTHPARLHRADASLGRRRLHLCGGSTRSGQRRCLADLSRLQLAWPPPGVVNATSGRRDRSCARARTADLRAAAGGANDVKPVGTGRPRDLGPGSATPPRACAAGFRRRSLRPGNAWPGDGGGAGPQRGRIDGGHGTRGRDLRRGDR
jgi:hypothetical protein